MIHGCAGAVLYAGGRAGAPDPRRALSPVELTDAVLARIERLNPTCQRLPHRHGRPAPRAAARAAEARALRGALLGPLDGIPYSIKDLEPTAGVRTTYGSKWFEHNVPDEDGAVAARLKAAGGDPARQDQHAALRLQGHVRQPARAALPQPLEAGAHLGRLLGGRGRRGRGRASARSRTARTARARSASPPRCAASSASSPRSGGCRTSPNADYWAARSHNGPMTRTVRDAALLLQVMAGPDHRDPLTIDAAAGRLPGRLRRRPAGACAWPGAPISATPPVDPEVGAIAERGGAPLRRAGLRGRGADARLARPARRSTRSSTK